MRKGLLFVMLAAGSVLVQGAGARVGFGVGLEKSIVLTDGGGEAAEGMVFDIFPVSFGTFSIPILIAEKVRIEPEIGYFRTGRTADQDLGDDTESSMSILQLALAVSGGMRRDNLLYHFGGRGGFTRHASSYDDGEFEDESSQMNFHFGPILGAEYFFHPGMSVGAQIGLSYIIIGQEESDDDSGIPTDDPDVSQSMFSNNAKISLRWYY